jgi:hypothetical protein
MQPALGTASLVIGRALERCLGYGIHYYYIVLTPVLTRGHLLSGSLRGDPLVVLNHA